MPDSPPEEAADKAFPPEEDGLGELRRLIAGPEQDRLNRLEQRLSDPTQFAEDLRRALPEAFIQGAAKDKRLGQALMPTVEASVQASIRRDPKTLVDILFPLMGPSIRKSIAETFRSMIQTLNQTLEHSVSWRGLRWRLEAMRSGKPFAEVVLSHTMLFAVEQVFLIHKDTGLLLQHVSAEHASTRDPDLISGMLTAIRDFVSDSFGGDRDGSLNTLRLGELEVWVEDGPHAILAGVIRGNPPVSLAGSFRDAMELIHLERRVELASFEGDTEPFAGIRHHLEACLAAQAKKEKRRASLMLWAVPVVLLVLLGAFGAWGYRIHRLHQDWDEYVARLDEQPGIVVTSDLRRDGKLYISGLRDPLAASPENLLGPDLEPDRIESRWEPYQALHPELQQARVERLLQPPASIRMEHRPEAVIASGTASNRWLQEARILGRSLPEGRRLDLDGVVNQDQEQLSELTETIQGQQVFFELSEPEPRDDQLEPIRQMSLRLAELRLLGERLDSPVQVLVVGHTDSVGTEQVNRRLSEERAESVITRLVAAGVPRDLLASRGVGSSEPLVSLRSSTRGARNRRVSFRVLFGDTVVKDREGP